MLTAKMLTATEVAVILNVTVETVWKWVRKGKIDSVRLPGGDVRIPRSALEQMGVKF